MPITQAQLDKAIEKQNEAAHDESPQVRLVAGPGTGKSFAIGERIHWLLSKNVPPETIYAVSFTRAASQDLKRRIIEYCEDRGHSAKLVNVSTLHSLALKVLRLGNLLETEPMVLDDWELKNIFDAEFAEVSGYPQSRCKELREIYEASLSTNINELAGHRLPNLPTEDEKSAFQSFHNSRNGVYHCVLPGEIIRMCVDEWKAGTVDPPQELKASHLIVDEYQDLNETDQEFVEIFIDKGVTTFICGDDDQSLYSFRFASPAGIQKFTSKYPHSGDYELADCFRCTVDILACAKDFINKHGDSNRLQKSTRSLYAEADPQNRGVVYRWKVNNGGTEAKIIAQSCKALIEAKEGVIKPRDLLILIANQVRLLPELKKAFQNEAIEYEPPREEGFVDSKVGRFIHALLRIICSENDYVAHRVLFGQLYGVATVTCNNLVQGVLEHRHNYKDIFHEFFMPSGESYETRTLNLLEKARDICDKVKDWISEDTLSLRLEQIENIIKEHFGNAQQFIEVVSHLPEEISLDELRAYFSADTDQQQERLLKGVYERLGVKIPEEGLLPQRVRMMTIHSSKGLDAPVVFILGLEEGILPRDKQKLYQADVNEAARMLYVAITRAKAACILSYSTGRLVSGNYINPTRSRFVPSLGGRFDSRNSGLEVNEVSRIIKSVEQLD